jgi:mannose-6-phosphate isomerase-like protein (cupin superfamily)
MTALTSTNTPTAHWSLGDLWIVHLGRDQTEGLFSLLETIWAPGFLAPLHVHRDTDELYYVLEGELTVHLPGRTVRQRVGGWVYCPREVPHTYEVTSPSPARLLYVGTPTGFEAFVVAAGEPAGALTLPPDDRTSRGLSRLLPRMASTSSPRRANCRKGCHRRRRPARLTGRSATSQSCTCRARQRKGGTPSSST